MDTTTTLVVVHTVFICITVGLLVAVIMTATSAKSCKREGRKATSADERIVGGQRANVKDYPFIAAIVVKKHGGLPKDSLQCGSSIISSKYLLTAAHCITLLEEQGFGKDVVYISTGNSMWSRGKKHTILNWTYNTKFNQQVMNDDIALIRVKETLISRSAKTIDVASRKYRYKGNVKIKVIGWGLLQSHSSNVQQLLRAVEVITYNHTYCKNLYGAQSQEVTLSMFCAGVKEGGKDACQFDSGGPIFVNNLQIGIVSWGIDCGQIDEPGVYTKLGLYQYWILTEAKKMGEPIVAKFKEHPCMGY